MKHTKTSVLPKAVWLLALTTLTQTASAEIVLQADFNGEHNGTGGPNDIVTFGGTGQLYDSNPKDDLTASANGILTLIDGPGKTNNSAGVHIQPDSAANGFNSMYTTGDSFDQLNGAVDFFFTSSGVEVQAASFRPLDIRFGPDNKIRFIITTNTGGSWALQLVVDGQILAATVGTKNFAYKPDTLYHLAATLETNSSGFIKAQLYIVEGNTTINKTDTPIAKATSRFKVQLNATGQALDNPAFEFGTRNDSIPKELSMDQFRIYNAVPDEFTILAVK
ncbi:hypothetical protein [Coraliomargarita parva]|uniref:hypothetical protein n=1 Tax=Coraliomargarita parva TaxID=3014050 RepID=UPI0022B45C15|nr:hypothetical protein [Coraliomargarita parva]